MGYHDDLAIAVHRFLNGLNGAGAANKKCYDVSREYDHVLKWKQWVANRVHVVTTQHEGILFTGSYANLNSPCHACD